VPVPLLTLEYGVVGVAALWLAMSLTRQHARASREDSKVRNL
jgi:uncharacterized membrane protein YuzA (DUF378 family)